ncbi:conserved hypothetical protein [Theileria orientalis strain Shintoku]|uniref:DEK-C domain-containing protein n=1 Tax=Theileria orientalis strain Shintoku TaxID=869250 RepID=J4CCZ6_THEOR|nr:conserved hypothetical protein [Theileria orientalis strain Shintoku]BAM40257.1 conserved hypothetical protein [Theileria orientalis strain Shintoku]|eukprot:XP_009690558.1 conserved hypothetical protein [Theileria orientalis strain Shintoku]
MCTDKESNYKITTSQIESAVRSIVTTEDLSQLTAGRVRKYLSDYFHTPREYMDSRESEINGIINQLLTEMASKKVKENNKDAASVSKNMTSKHESFENPENNGLVSQLKEEIANDVILMKTLEETQSKNGTKAKPERKVKQERRVKAEEPAEPEVVEEPPRKVSKLQQDLMTKEFFLENARSLEVKIGDSDPIFAKPRAFSTGNLGWFINSKTTCKVGDQEVICQVGVTCTAIGSKNWKD